jgi:beta-glucosidase
MWTFQDAVRAGAGSIMCSYNKLNGSYGCQNSKALNGLLKGELGFKVREQSLLFSLRSGILTNF